MDRHQLNQRLMQTFVVELEERLDGLNRSLLGLEKASAGEERSGILKVLFRTAHSLKGAARSVSLPAVENVCHQLEEIFAALQDGRLSLDPGLMQVLFTAADAIAEARTRLRTRQDLAEAPLASVLGPLAKAAQGRDGPPGESRPERAPTQAGTKREPASEAGSEIIRIPAERLDALLTLNGEVLLARQRLEMRGKEIAVLREHMERVRQRWPQVSALRKRMQHDADAESGVGTAVVARANGFGRRAAHALEDVEHELHRLQEGMQLLAGRLNADRRALDHTAARMEDQIRRARLVPFITVCAPFERVVRDVAKGAGKEIDLVVEGGEVQCDRAILDSLGDPLLHLVRNAAGHGIEMPGERVAAGKPARGRITISAAIRRGRLEIAVADDGRGLDVAAIREQVRRRQIREPNDDRELAMTIFMPGFSTSESVTTVSGRGIGLDVVKTAVESIRGSVVVSFESGRGARFVLDLPITLSVLRALLVEAGGCLFAFDAADVQGMLRIRPDEPRMMEGREVLTVSEAPIPVARLAGLLALPVGDEPAGGDKVPVVLLAAGNRRAAVAVDGLLAQQSLVVKSLGRRLRRLPLIAGATILPDGRVALILNGPRIVQRALDGAPGRTGVAELAKPTAEARKHLLVVDDSVTTRTLVKSILENAGYQVTAAADGAEAWQLLQERGADLVVCDVEMPRMDGFALTEAIRASKRFADLPVVLVTSRESDQDKRRGLDVGADAYLPKSTFDQRHLFETILQLL